MELEKLSATRLCTYLTCQFRYYCRYVMGEKIRPSGAMVLGSHFHQSVGFNYEQKVVSHEDLKLDDVVEHFAAGFQMGQHEALWQPGEDPGKFLDTGVSIIREYQGVVAPDIQPFAVEKKFLLTTKEYNFPFEGYIDCVTVDDSIVETKTTGKTPKTPMYDHILQTLFYAMMFRVQGVEETSVRFDYAVKTKTPKILTFQRNTTYRDLVLISSLIQNVVGGIQNEIWIPNRSDKNWSCNKRWCGYHEICERKNGGRVRD